MSHYLSKSLLLLFAFVGISCSFNQSAEDIKSQDSINQSPVKVADTLRTITPIGASALIKAYPEQHLVYKDNNILFPDGMLIPYDDKMDKDFISKLDNSDIEDMFSMPYDTIGQPDYLADAGRSRCEKLFKEMYGKTAAEVQKHLVSVPWFGQHVSFTSVNGASKQLELVAKEITLKYPQLKKYMKSCGTFYWRKVRGANRMSAHSYGIAIDINTEYSDYWLWKNGKVSETKKIGYTNRIPMEIVRVFEKYGFVWGGRWYHYDTMHFEYRPEIIQYESEKAIQ